MREKLRHMGPGGLVLAVFIAFLVAGILLGGFGVVWSNARLI